MQNNIFKIIALKNKIKDIPLNHKPECTNTSTTSVLGTTVVKLFYSSFNFGNQFLGKITSELHGNSYYSIY